jgi:hypothetical protein
MVLWGVPFVVIGQYMIWGRFLYDAWLKPRTYYGITNRRVLMRARNGRLSSDSWTHTQDDPRR